MLYIRISRQSIHFSPIFQHKEMVKRLHNLYSSFICDTDEPSSVLDMPTTSPFSFYALSHHTRTTKPYCKSLGRLRRLHITLQTLCIYPITLTAFSSGDRKST